MDGNPTRVKEVRKSFVSDGSSLIDFNVGYRATAAAKYNALKWSKNDDTTLPIVCHRRQDLPEASKVMREASTFEMLVLVTMVTKRFL